MISDTTSVHRTSIVLLALAAALVLVGTAGCALQDDWVEPLSGRTTCQEQAIINGIATEDWPAIGALVVEAEYRGGELAQFCSGTLIDPEWVLTAGHCVVVEIPTTGGDTVDLTPEMVSFFIGPDVSGPGELYEFDSFHPHPRFIPGAPLVRDIALAHLGERVPSSVAQPMPINDQEITWDWEGLEITWVGYGVTDGLLQTGNGVKRYGIGRLGPVALDMFAYEMSEDGQLPCNGDSGGASLLDFDGIERVIGVTHMGSEGCTTSGFDTRVDPFYTWIQDLLATTRQPCLITGGDCDAGEACQPVEETFECQPSGSLALSDPCLVAPDAWPPYPCGDGLTCLDITVAQGGIGAACYAFCLSDEDCVEVETCLVPVLDGHADLGVCVCRDEDGDGACRVDDCDDGDATAHPLADEICDDGIDNDCNGLIDQQDAALCAGSTGSGQDEGGCFTAGTAVPTGPRPLTLLLLAVLWLGLTRRRRDGSPAAVSTRMDARSGWPRGPGFL